MHASCLVDSTGGNDGQRTEIPFRAFRYMGRVRCGVKSGSLAKLREAVASGKIKRVHKGMLGAVSIPGNPTRL